MLIYAGIDEAGYGPLLGPLCVASSTFVLEEYDPAAGPPNLWGMLKSAVCRSATDKRRRIAINDSKKLKGSNDAAKHPLRWLERGVLAFLPNAGPTDSDDRLFEALGARLPPCDWYTSPTSLPLARTPEQILIDRARVGRCLNRAGVQLQDLSCEIVDAGDFNDQCERMGTKAAVNFCAAVRLIDRVRRAFPDRHPRVVIDRHGGRMHYRDELQLVFPDAFITVLAERETVSRYLIDDGSHTCTVSFEVEGDGRHLPIALASMTAKYVRELGMMRLNRYFASHLPELKPTAGYYQDGRRYLQEIGPLLPRLRIDRRELVRSQ